jgi:hypothetical protein
VTLGDFSVVLCLDCGLLSNDTVVLYAVTDVLEEHPAFTFRVQVYRVRNHLSYVCMYVMRNVILTH